MDKITLNLNELADGAIKEKLSKALERVAANILDPNTDQTKVRKVSIGLSFKPDENGVIKLTSDVKATLAPDVSVTTTVLIGRGDDGYVEMNELKSGARGQTFFDPKDSVLKDDKGTPIQDGKAADAPIDFRKVKNAKEAN